MILTEILLPEGALDNATDAVENFRWLVDTTSPREVLWSPDGTDEVVNLYFALWYEGEVNNGGHAQFVSNSDNQRPIAIAAQNGLRVIGAQPYERFVEATIAWAQHHSDEVARVLNWSELPLFQPPMLTQLDDLFFAEKGDHQVRDYALAWLRLSPRVSVIPKEAFNEAVLKHQAKQA